MTTTKELFDQLYTDLCQLQDGEWKPDRHSTQDSIDNLVELADRFGFSELQDLREEQEVDSERTQRIDAIMAIANALEIPIQILHTSKFDPENLMGVPAPSCLDME